MESTKSTTRDRILSSALEEFLKVGFRSASLRSIVKKAGVTTGAFYGYFKSKEQLFDALAGDEYRCILAMYRQVLTDFQALPPEQQQTSMMDCTQKAVSEMTDYIYSHLPAFRLLLCCAEGTGFEHLVEDMASIDVDATHDFKKSMEDMGLPMLSVNEKVEHMLTSGMFSAYFELVIHQVPREEADLCIRQLLAFYNAGWQRIMGY